MMLKIKNTLYLKHFKSITITLSKKKHPKSVNGGINISVKNVEQIRYEPPSVIISACRNKRICKSVMFACEERGVFLKPNLRLSLI